MAADTALKRYSAMNISLPFRGLNVVPQTASSAAERFAVMYYYSGVAGNQPPTPGSGQDIVYAGYSHGCGGYRQIVRVSL